jgi:hypothetical protein
MFRYYFNPTAIPPLRPLLMHGILLTCLSGYLRAIVTLFLSGDPLNNKYIKKVVKTNHLPKTLRKLLAFPKFPYVDKFFIGFLFFW